MTTTILAAIPSPAQGVWHLGPVPIRAYALFIIVGIVAAIMIGDRRWVARGGQEGAVYDIALLPVIFGLIGGRLYHVITDWWRYFGEGGAGLVGALRIWDGGLGIWGAVALGGVGAWIACRRRGIPLPAFGDAIAPGIILAQAIGRIGNYFNQELYGGPTTVPWALKIYERRDASGAVDNLNGVSTGEVLQYVHPTFLYELIWNLLVFAALIWIDRRFKIGHGRLFATYVAGYCLGRFWIELMRVDDATHIDGIRVNSFTSMLVFIGAVVYIMVAPKGREDPATLRGKPKDDEVEDDGSSVEEIVKELSAVGATTGLVAAAKAAGDAEDEDAKAAGDADEPESKAELSAEEMGADVAGVPADSLEEAEEFAAEGDDGADEPEPDESAAEAEEPAEPEVDKKPEAAVEAEELAEEVAEAPAGDIAEAVEFAAAGAEADSAVGGVGAVEGEDAVEAEEAAPEVHEAAVEATDEAEAVTDEVAAEGEPAEPAAEEKPEAGVEAVEGEDAVEAEEAAPEVHEAALEATDEAEAVADEVAAEGEPAEPEAEKKPAAAVAEAPGEDITEAEDFAAARDEADSAVSGVGPVEGERAVEAQEAAPEVHEAAVEATDEAQAVAVEVAAEDEPAVPEVEAEVEAPEAVGEAEEVAAESEAAGPAGEAVADGVAAEDEPAEPEVEAEVEAPEAVGEAEEVAAESEAEAAPESPATVQLAVPEPSGGLVRRWLRNRRRR
ncbi:prolipoprotein diacylglyceryl transferase [Mycobacterium sp. URHB0021]